MSTQGGYDLRIAAMAARPRASKRADTAGEALKAPSGRRVRRDPERRRGELPKQLAERARGGVTSTPETGTPGSAVTGATRLATRRGTS